MHALHKHLSQTLADKLVKRGVVVWYDGRGEFKEFVAELTGENVPATCQVDTIAIDGKAASLCVMQDSFFEAKFAVESIVSGDSSEPLLLYLPEKKRDDDTAVLMELEAGGERWEPQLKREARRVLKKQLGDGQIDGLLASPGIGYADIVGILAGGQGQGTSGSLLEVIYNAKDNATILASWLATDDEDSRITEKGAIPELRDLLSSRLGLELEDEFELEDARRKACRYVLLGEFRNDLKCDAPPSLNLVEQPTGKQLELVLAVAEELRETHSESYVTIADSIEQELHLKTQGIAPETLGKIDTFRFEEECLLEYVGQQIETGNFQAALEIVEHRRLSFWALNRLQRQEQWQAYSLAAQLGLAVTDVSAQLPDAKKTAVHWVEGYSAEKGWYRVDLLHRRLESALSAMTDTIVSEKVIHRVRKDYEKLLNRMTGGFIAAFKDSDWSLPGVMHQTEVYSREVQTTGEPVCFILVDALRYEMGVELKGLLEVAEQLSLEPAIAAIPTITPIGMAALMPGADESFSVVESGKDLGAKIENSVSGSLNDRRKVWKGRVPDVVDLELDKVLSHSPSQLKKRIAAAPLVVVRSIEIDAMGEGGNTFLARQVMDTAINNVARAIKRLSLMGISKFVVAADHGHLFIHERDESERIDKPGGEQVSLHRRCWAGRGGATAPGTVRVSAEQLGYDSDLDFVFPASNSVFKAGGDLAYYHGGLSLQELLIPVLSIRMPSVAKEATSDIDITLSKIPEKIANRIVTFGISAGNSLFSQDDFSVRPVLLSAGQHVGHVGMVLDAEHEQLTHCVRMKPGTKCTVGVQLLNDSVTSVEIVVLDPETDRILAKSNKIPVKLGI
ncbi:PglZ domain-containing protein [Crateriforma conspicua]|uniref:PglZ domain-containing protein n=1 Tax=Crateriforma conspicua TaxID=2527996 RepID=UPI00118AA393|nr:PglZ domain-containing protein [Crateriforma conspicua]QDV62036.1 PglZ domain protein [Crateriforma conspicua]